MKPKYIDIDGQRYWSANGLAVELRRTRQSVNLLVNRGILRRVVINGGVWFVLAQGYELKEVTELRIVSTYRWLWIWELAEMEGISENEVMDRVAIGVYKYSAGKVRFLDDYEWSKVEQKAIDSGCGNVKRGDEYALITDDKNRKYGVRIKKD